MDDTSMITYIGRVDHRNKLTRFGIRAKDRTKHMYVIGKTGTGKSTFLENMLVQDIQNGHGVAFIDPHGGSAEKLLNYIPEWRINDVIYFDVSDTDFPIAFNPLEDLGPMKRPLIADGLMSVFKKIWPDAFSGRMEYILNNTMLALLEYPDPTILGINRMLTDKEFRKKVVANVSDPIVKNAWDELMKWDDKRWSEASGALINKVGQFSTNPLIRNIIGQSQSTFDFRKAMDERKIIIINLSKGKIGEQNAPLLGAMLITKIYLAAMSRAELPAHVIEKMPPFYFYVDEFQNFANDSFANILSEARKYKLCLTVANQYIAQMEETIRDAVFGNMGTTVSFRVGPLDAEFMEKVLAPIFTADDLQNIAFGQYYVTLQIDGMGSKPFSAQGLPPIPPLQNSLKDQVMDASRSQFARPRAEVESMLADWFGFNKKPDTKVVRTDIGSEESPEGVVPPRPRTPTTYMAPARTPASPQQGNGPRETGESRTKTPLPPIQGFRKDTAKNPVKPLPPKKNVIPQSTIKQTETKTIIAEKKPILGEEKVETTTFVPLQKNKEEGRMVPPLTETISSDDSVENLLKGFDEGTLLRHEDKVPETTPSLVQETALIPEVKPLPPTESVTPKIPVPQKKPLDRAAGDTTKSALAEALARAMQAKKEATPEPVIQTSSEKTLSLQEVLAQAQNSSEPVIIPEIISQEVVNKELPSVPEDKVEIDTFIPPTPISVIPPVVTPLETPVIPEIPLPPTPPRSTTPREVPEDILRRVLE
jgi:hypothetical protein